MIGFQMRSKVQKFAVPGPARTSAQSIEKQGLLPLPDIVQHELITPRPRKTGDETSVGRPVRHCNSQGRLGELQALAPIRRGSKKRSSRDGNGGYPFSIFREFEKVPRHAGEYGGILARLQIVAKEFVAGLVARDEQALAVRAGQRPIHRHRPGGQLDRLPAGPLEEASLLAKRPDIRP